MSRKRKLVWAVFLCGAVVLIAAAAAVLFLRSARFREMVRSRTVSTVEDATGGRVELASFDLDWRTLTAEVRGFTLHGKEAPHEFPLFHASRIAVGISLLPGGPRKVALRSLTIERPRFNFIVYPDGSNNFPVPRILLQARRHPVERLIELAIGRLTITQGVFSVAEHEVPLFADGVEFHAVLDHHLVPARYAGSTSWRRLTVQIADLSPVLLDASAGLLLESDRLQLTSLRLTGKQTDLRANFGLRDFRHPEIELDFRGEVAVAEAPLPRALPVLRQGVVRVQGEARKTHSALLFVRAEFAGRNLGYRDEYVQIGAAAAAGEFTYQGGQAAINRLTLSALGGTFRGLLRTPDLHSWHLEGEVSQVDLNQLAAAARQDLPFSYAGNLSGPVMASWTLKPAAEPEFRARAQVQVAGSSSDVRAPLEGFVDITYAHRPRSVRLARSYLRTPTLHVLFDGDLAGSIQFELNILDVERALREFPRVASRLEGYPVNFAQARLEAKGALGQVFTSPVLSARATLTGGSVKDLALTRVSALVAASRAAIAVRSFDLEAPELALHGDGEVRAKGDILDENAQIDGKLTIRRADLESLLEKLEVAVPLEAELGGDLSVSGTWRSPDVVGTLRAPRLVCADEEGANFSARFSLAASRLTLQDARVDVGGGRLRAEGVYTLTEPEQRWDSGALAAAVTVSKIQMSRLTGDWKPPAGVDALLDGQFRASFTLRPVSEGKPKLDITAVDGVVNATSLKLQEIALGSASLRAVTSNRVLQLRTVADIAKTQLRGFASISLRDDYPIRGSAVVGGVLLESLQPFFTQAADSFPVTGTFGGAFTFTGSAFDFGTWRGELVFPEVVIVPPAPASSPPRAATLEFRNDGPVQFRLAQRTLRVERARMSGPDTDLELSGSAGLAAGIPLALRLRGKVNLKLAERWQRDLLAEGVSELDAFLRGTFDSPQFQGKLLLSNASVYLREGPFGVEQANGVVNFDRRRANIEQFTARAGGGDLRVSGFIQLGEEDVLYRLQLMGKGIRIRYPEGVSSTSSANLSFSGTSRSSVLAGDVVVERASINPRLDIGSLLTQANRAPATAPTSELLRGMRLAVQVRLAPDAQIQTSLTRDIEAQADLTLRGSGANIVVLGRISVTEGEINFFSNRYTINRGEVTFENPARNEAVLDLDLQTRTRGIDVNLTFTGPISKLNVSYRSDPPLQLSEILSLLATGRNPNVDPQFQARQSQVSQSWQQIGGNTLVAQALTAPVTNRLQQLFGISRIRIDPQVTGLDSEPQARVTVEQQITRDVIFVYSTNLVGTQNQAVRVDWDFNKNWSATGGRNEFGVLSVDFFFRKRF